MLKFRPHTAQLVRDARKRWGLSCSEVAPHIGIKEDHLRRIETKGTCSQKVMDRLWAFYGLDPALKPTNLRHYGPHDPRLVPLDEFGLTHSERRRYEMEMKRPERISFEELEKLLRRVPPHLVGPIIDSHQQWCEVNGYEPLVSRTPRRRAG